MNTLNNKKNNNIFDMNMFNYMKNNNFLIWILWIIRKIIINFRCILCITRKKIIFTTQIIIFFILTPRIVVYF
jgi:hypothetical protein